MAYRAELTKWWKAYTPVHGETIRSVSPYNQKIMGPLFKNAGHKVSKHTHTHTPASQPAFAT